MENNQRNEKNLKTENTIKTNQGSMFNENEYINLIRKNPEYEIKYQNNEFAKRVKKDRIQEHRI